ncbi:molybdopterin cofactor-binding domain-containing protein, partial [Streptomyces sp. NPDC052676]|uniref:xanthine dehydrogenase family protein molybdopterin-binding subunit n=1 Tax=Streptomyces sp. NPDC052676 TaxID=3154953 RepID=UPI003419CD3A
RADRLRARPLRSGPRLLIGEGLAVAAQHSVPADGHIARAAVTLRDDGHYELATCVPEFGTGTGTVLRRIAAHALGTEPDRIHLCDADTDLLDHHSGGFASTGVILTGQAVARACQALAERLNGPTGDDPSATEAARTTTRPRATGTARAEDTVPSLAFCAQWFRVEVDTATGLVRVLDSVHVADAGTVLDAEQCRGQVEGAVVQGIGITLHEQLLGDGDGRITTSDLRTYDIPRLGDAPLTEVHLLPPHSGDRTASPKPMSELPLVTVAPALANALRDATGIRFTTLPVRPDTLWAALAAAAATTAADGD